MAPSIYQWKPRIDLVRGGRYYQISFDCENASKEPGPQVFNFVYEGRGGCASTDHSFRRLPVPLILKDGERAEPAEPYRETFRDHYEVWHCLRTWSDVQRELIFIPPRFPKFNWDWWRLGRNRYTGGLFPDFMPCGDPLKVVNLRLETGLTFECIQHLRRYQQLQRLDLGSMIQVGALPELANAFPQLRSLSLCMFGLDWEEDLSALALFPQLETLRLSTPRLYELDLSMISRLKNLRRLHLAHSHLNGDIVFSLRGLSKLRELHLDISGTTDKHIVEMSRYDFARNLQILRLFGTRLSDKSADVLARSFGRIEDLSLGGTHLTDEGCSRIAACPNLKRLSLSFTSVSDKSIDCLRRIPNLQLLGLRHTEMSSTGLLSLQRDRVDCRIEMFHLW